jgi:ABC-2 type transport system ATP-binding protein
MIPRTGARSGEAGLDSDRDQLPAALQLVGLSKRYNDALLAVDDVSLRVEGGQVFGLLGPNGAGKTTILRMALGLVRPTAGAVHVLGEVMRPGHPVLHRVGSLIEGPAFVPHLSGMENLEFFWRAGGGRMEDSNLAEALEIAGLGDAIHRKVRTYSTGMGQRLALAQALLKKPDLLLLDEPTVGLDPSEMREIRALLREIAGRGATVVLSSHILAEVEQVCSHAAVLAHGRLVSAGSVTDLTSAVTSVYIEAVDLEAALHVLKSMEGVSQVKVETPGVSLHLEGVSRSELVAALVRQGVGVETVTSRHSLEDAFLALLGESS